MYLKDFIKLLTSNLAPDTEIKFLLADHNKPFWAFLKVDSVNMNADIDEPSNRRHGGVVFSIEKELTRFNETKDKETKK